MVKPHRIPEKRIKLPVIIGI